MNDRDNDSWILATKNIITDIAMVAKGCYYRTP